MLINMVTKISDVLKASLLFIDVVIILAVLNAFKITFMI